MLQGQRFCKIKATHEKYGPIGRTNPRDLHVKTTPLLETQDLDVGTDEMGSTTRSEAPGSIFSTVDHMMNAIDSEARRGACSFSKKAVAEMQPLIASTAKAEELRQRFSRAAEDKRTAGAHSTFKAVMME